MVYYLLLPFCSIILVVFQTTIADIIFSGRLVIELSIIVIIYAGYRLDLIRGSVLAFALGFVFDCLAGSVLGLFTFAYVLVFLLSFFVSASLTTEKIHFIAIFALICVVLEEFVIFLFYNLAYGFDVLHIIPLIFLPQALIVGLLAPVFFYLMRRIEVFFYGKTVQPAQWSGPGRIQTET
jgi:rod shape-determining protein MreD